MAKPPFIVIPYEPVTIQATSSATGRPPSHMGEYLYPSMIWLMPTAQAAQTILMNIGTPRPIDFLALLGTPYSATTKAGMNLGTTEGVGDLYGSPVASVPPVAQSPGRQDSSVDFWHDLTATITAQHVTVDVLSHSGPPFSSKFLVVGEKIRFTHFAEHDWEIGGDDLSQVSFTRGGVPDIAEGIFQRTLSFTLKWVSEAEYFEKVAPLDALVGKRKPVLICFDEDAGSRRQALTFFGLLVDNPRNRRANARAFERRFEIRSFI